jgi:diguanylate cyclase (GGDEF)-like protein/PAS domain S-box-containing protein
MKAALEPTGDVAVQYESVPADEAERLISLHRLGLLDTPPAPAFDAVTRLAQAALQVPILCVSLVDQNRVWFKSRIGLSMRETPRQGAFCDQAILSRQPLLVRDAAADPRFARNPLVTGPQQIRAYLGMPLFTRDRQPVGTLCAMDPTVREFGEAEVVVLGEFAKIAQELLSSTGLVAKSDSVLQYAMEREKLFREIFDQAPVGIVQTSLQGLILRINQRACALLGYSPAEFRELSIPSITHPEDLPRNIDEFKRTLAGETDGYRIEQRLLCKDQRYVWAQLSVALKRTPSHQPDYNIVAIEEISAQKQAEADATRVREALEEKLASQWQRIHEINESLQMQGTRAQEAADELRVTQEALRAAEAALQAANAKLAQDNATDPLTLLPNRRSFSRRSEQAANALRQSRKPYGLILLDVDDLKQINQEYGHDVGDDVLRALRDILITQLRNSSDMAARLDGAEFAVLCFGDINEQILHDVAERIHGQIAKEPLATAKGLLHFSASFGVALSIADDPDWRSLYRRAGAALREAKTAGKDRISFGRSQSKSATARLRALAAPSQSG